MDGIGTIKELIDLGFEAKDVSTILHGAEDNVRTIITEALSHSAFAGAVAHLKERHFGLSDISIFETALL